MSGFIKDEVRFSGAYSSSVIETLKFAYRRYLAVLAIMILIGFVGRVFLLGNANLIGHWVDRFCREPMPCRPLPAYLADKSDSDFFFLLLSVTVVGFGLTVLFRIVFSRLSAKAVSRLYDEVTYRTSRFNMRFFDTTPVGAVVTRFSSDYGNVFRLFGGPLAEFFVIIFDLTAMLLLVGLASPWFLPIFLLTGFLNWLVYRINRDRLRRERREMSLVRAPSIAHFSETIQGSNTIRVFGKQNSFIDRFQALNRRFLRQKRSTAAAVFGFSFQMTVLSAALLLLTGLAGIHLVSQGSVSIGAIGVAFTFIVLSSGSMQMFFEWMAQFEEAMTGVERLDHYLRSPIEPGSQLPTQAEFVTNHARQPGETGGAAKSEMTSRRSQMASVEVKDLWFRYSPDAPYVLKGVGFHVAPGEKLGIVGRTGSGKSSLVQALFHLYPIERGEIWLNGRQALLDGRRQPRANELNLDQYRRSIALISQEPTLFRGSVRENLALGEDHSDEELIRVLGRVGLHRWLQDQPHGLATTIEERGRNLSLGERQLLCMARCLLQDAPLIIMDEATSAIDPQSEEILMRATAEFFKGRTQLIIAHRLSTLESVDRVLWLKDGEVYQIGSPQKVLAEIVASTGPNDGASRRI